jgi:curved DNA-binding protein CbpA
MLWSKLSALQNKRNYYRILCVQPDAAAEVIRGNYRAMLQTLRMHPDLGGEHGDAALLNEAYAMLRHPERRQRYDEALMARYGIEVIASGGASVERRSQQPRGSNNRNFYRLLQVQHDAPIELIEASYRTLSKSPGRLDPEIAVALTVLRDPALRARYDKVLHRLGHAHAREEALQSPMAMSPTREGSEGRPERGNAQAYTPLITAYCTFCKTPLPPTERTGTRWRSERRGSQTRCVECASPITRSTTRADHRPARSAVRKSAVESIAVHTHWPSEPRAAQLLDWSATGASLRLHRAGRLTLGQDIKLDGAGLAAIARVVRSDTRREFTTIAVDFITIAFTTNHGHFVSVSI